MAYPNKEEHIYRIGDVVSADSDYQISIPSAFYMTISELLDENVDDLDKALFKVYKMYFKEADSSLGYDEIYVITKGIKITYEY